MEQEQLKNKSIRQVSNESIRKFVFRFTKAMFFCMSIALACLMTYTYDNWQTISTKHISTMDNTLWLIITSAYVGVVIFFSLISAVFVDYKEKVK
jgi:hypothetical protein